MAFFWIKHDVGVTKALHNPEEIGCNYRDHFRCKFTSVGLGRHELQVLRMLDLPDELMLTVTTKPKEALIHVDFLGALRPERLQKRINESEWTHAVGFRPTGPCLFLSYNQKVCCNPVLVPGTRTLTTAYCGCCLKLADRVHGIQGSVHWIYLTLSSSILLQQLA